MKVQALTNQEQVCPTLGGRRRWALALDGTATRPESVRLQFCQDRAGAAKPLGQLREAQHQYQVKEKIHGRRMTHGEVTVEDPASRLRRERVRQPAELQARNLRPVGPRALSRSPTRPDHYRALSPQQQRAHRHGMRRARSTRWQAGRPRSRLVWMFLGLILRRPRPGGIA